MNFKVSTIRKIILVTNMPVHHQIDLFDAIDRLGRIDLQVFYLRRMSFGRLWNTPSELNHIHEFLPEIRITGHWYVNRGVVKLFKALGTAELVIIGQYASITMQLAMYFCSARHVPWVFWSEPISGVRYSENPLVKSERLRKALRQLAIVPIKKWARECWGVGEMAVESFGQTFSHARFAVLPYYSDLEPFFQISHSSSISERFTFVFCGSLTCRKGFDILVSAVESLASSVSVPFTVRVIGDGPMRGSIPRHLEGYFDQRGFVQRDQVAECYESADVFVFPSRYDGWGMSLVEALASGLPTISSANSGAALDIIQPGENGWLLDQLRKETLAAKMRWCLNNKNELRSMSIAARESVRDYDASVGAHHFVDLTLKALSESDRQ